MRQDTLYIGESDSRSKSERSMGVICEKPSRMLGQRNPKLKCTCHERWAWHKPNLLSTPCSSVFFYLDPRKSQNYLHKLVL